MTSASDAPSGRHLGFRAWLLLISLAGGLPVLVFALLTVHRLLDDAHAREIATLERRTAIAATAIEREFERYRTVARVLSLTNVAVRGDIAGLHDVSSRIVRDDPGVFAISVVRDDGRRLLSTRRGPGEVGEARPLSALEQRVLASGRTAVTPMVSSGREGVPVFAVLQAVQPAGGERWLLRLAVHPDELQAVLTSLQWPTDWTAGVMDSRLAIVARSRDAQRFRGEPATLDLQAHLRQGAPGLLRGFTKDGVPSVVAAARVGDTDWWVAVGLPASELDRQAREPLLWTLVLGLAGMGLGVAVALWLGRSLSAQLRRTVEGGHGAAPSVPELQQLVRQTRRASDALHDARHDTLTGLPGRALFLEEAARRCAVPGTGVAVLYLDVDGFKAVNDRLGHDAGDRVLVRVAEVLRRSTRREDWCGRLGGDEFVVLMQGPPEALRPASTDLAERLVREVAALGEGLGGSVGVARAVTPLDVGELIARADQAMLEAKRAGKGRVVQAGLPD